MMKPSQVLRLHRSKIREVVLSHNACNVRVFGSAAVGCDTEASDLDILVDPTPETTLMGHWCDSARITGSSWDSGRCGYAGGSAREN